jgi:formylglycine-generating enzyme required for sulfatase activity
MEFVTIGNPGNSADSTGDPNPAGSVGYTYDIGKFEVSRDMITKYNVNFGTANSRAITLFDMTVNGGTNGGNGPNQPATGVSWNEAARFVNWLNTSTGNQAAYKFTTNGVNDNIAVWTAEDAGYDANNKYRNSLAKYFLPSYNEWYKAAYYDPNTSTYYDYTTGSNTAPSAVASGTTAGTEVYGQSYGQGPADVTNAGGLSPYGVMGLGGNVGEWEESSGDLLNSSGSSSRGIRGGYWYGNVSSDLSSSTRINDNPSFQQYGNLGFRVASLSPSAPPVVPEPSMMVIGSMLGIGGLMAKGRMKKRSA